MLSSIIFKSRSKTSHPIDWRPLQDERQPLCHRDADDVNVVSHAGGLQEQANTLRLHSSPDLKSKVTIV